MKGDVQQTLLELERKLRELQAQLAGPAADQAAEHPRAERPYVQPPAAHQPPPPPPAPAGPLEGRLDELLRFRDQLAAAANTLVEDYTRLLEQLERVAPAAPPPAAAGHATFPVPPPTPSSREGTPFSGQVRVEAGPFADIGAVVAFESALRSVAQAHEVHVRSFDDGRAVFGLHLAGEVPLVFELRRASEQAFDVQEAGPGRLVLALHAPGDVPFPMRP